jgi:hypothetical protein
MNTLRVFLFLTAITVAAESASSQSAGSDIQKPQPSQPDTNSPKNNQSAKPKTPDANSQNGQTPGGKPLDGGNGETPKPPLSGNDTLSELKPYLALSILLSLIAITLQIWFKPTKRQKSKSPEHPNEQVSSRSSSSVDSDISALKNGQSVILGKLNQQTGTQRELERKVIQLRERDRDIEELRNQISNRENSIAEEKKAKQELEAKVTNLSAENSRIPSLEDSIATAKNEIETVRATQERERAEFKLRLASFFPESTDAELSLSIDELKAATVRSDANARAALSCLVFIRAAESGQVEEEALLSVLRQFSESLAAYLKSTGCNPLQVAGVLAQWADDLGTRFSTRTKIRVPSIGYPIEISVMSTDSSASKVSEVASWCVYNSKGGIYAAARVS